MAIGPLNQEWWLADGGTSGWWIMPPDECATCGGGVLHAAVSASDQILGLDDEEGDVGWSCGCWCISGGTMPGWWYEAGYAMAAAEWWCGWYGLFIKLDTDTETDTSGLAWWWCGWWTKWWGAWCGGRWLSGLFRWGLTEPRESSSQSLFSSPSPSSSKVGSSINLQRERTRGY